MSKPVGLIVASDPNGVIGVEGGIPWRYKADLQRFKALTSGGTLIMGRRTFESMGRRHLPGRISFVVSTTPQPDVQTHATIEAALKNAKNLGQPIWFIGGSQIYRDVLVKGLVDFADVTIVPTVVVPAGACIATFPLDLLAEKYGLTSTELCPDAPLEHRRYHPLR